MRHLVRVRVRARARIRVGVEVRVRVRTPRLRLGLGEAALRLAGLRPSYVAADVDQHQHPTTNQETRWVDHSRPAGPRDLRCFSNVSFKKESEQIGKHRLNLSG